jgi:hypothetical protein
MIKVIPSYDFKQVIQGPKTFPAGQGLLIGLLILLKKGRERMYAYFSGLNGVDKEAISSKE